MSVFDGYEFDEHGWTTSNDEMPEAMNGLQLQALINDDSSKGVAVRCVRVGPRGGVYAQFGGDRDELLALRRRVDAALDYEAKMRLLRLAWLKEREDA